MIVMMLRVMFTVWLICLVAQDKTWALVIILGLIVARFEAEDYKMWRFEQNFEKRRRARELDLRTSKDVK